MTTWLPVYGPMILKAAKNAGLDPFRLASVVWQESNGGLSSRTGIWSPASLYRYEAGFWDRYLARHPDYQPPDHTSLDHWKRRVSASYGICQVLFATARGTVCHIASCLDQPRHNFLGEPEQLMDPMVSLVFGAAILKHSWDFEQNWRSAYLHYNGGGRLAYADEAEDKYRHLAEMNSRWLLDLA